MLTRVADMSDVADACQLLNEIIEIGGTTAYYRSMSDSEFAQNFISGENCVSCFICEDKAGSILGFQALQKEQNLPQFWLSIATFARARPKVRGVGTMLFDATLAYASSTDLLTINATIRADNHAGLAYYSKMGFVDYRVEENVPLSDGTPVDRISKRFDFSPIE